MSGTDYYTVEDFLLDDTFADWAAGGRKHESFWLQYLEEFPAKADVIQQAIEIVRAFRVKEVNQISDSDIDDIVEKVKHRIAARQPEKPVIHTPWFTAQWHSFAAIVLLLLLTASYFYHFRYTDHQKIEQFTVNGYKTITNHSPQKILAKLSDHSSVILSPNACLRYPIVFSAAKREAWLSGEAFFEITKNPHQPFFVYSDELKIRVLGTSFSVKANQKDKIYQVTVSTGKVSVYTKTAGGNASASKPVILSPNQAALFNRRYARLEKAVLRHPSLLSDESAEKHLRFEEAPFSQVVAALEKAYGIKIIYNEKDMDGCLLTASLTGAELDERLNLICKAVEASYSVDYGTIVITGKGCN
jgi:transmembrane sensor